MKKNIADYLHLYLGCGIVTNFGINPPVYYILKGIQIEGKDVVLYCDKEGLLIKRRMSFHDFKPILRPLSDMSEEEAWQAFNEANDDSSTTNPKLAIQDKIWFPAWNISQWSASLNWLRKQGFDCDGLIEAGLAIDAATLKHKA